MSESIDEENKRGKKKNTQSIYRSTKIRMNADFMKTMLVEDLLSDMSLKKLQLIEKCSNLAIANHNFRLL